MATLPDASVDCVLTDLPYGTTANKWDSIIPLDELWSSWKRICTPGAPIILFAQQPFASTLVASNPRWFRHEWIWSKPQGAGFLNAKRAPLRSHENILVFCERAPTYRPQMRTGHKPYRCVQGNTGTNYSKDSTGIVTVSNGERYPLTVLDYNRDKQRLHPTAKPVALLEYLIRTYTNPGDTVNVALAGIYDPTDVGQLAAFAIQFPLFGAETTNGMSIAFTGYFSERPTRTISADKPVGFTATLKITGAYTETAGS
jgi:site-specific DNA-methyltransferase (adenine-specific)